MAMEAAAMAGDRPSKYAASKSNWCIPTAVCRAQSEFTQTGVKNNCLKGVKWSPDGSCLLTASEDQQLRLFNLPYEIAAAAADDPDNSGGAECEAPFSDLRSALSVKEGDSVYDYCWYPLMSSADPLTCCFLSSSKDHPIHMWDAYDGSLRASYIPRNHLDELTAAYALAFDPTGSRIYCGFERAVRVFDVTRPGCVCTTRPTCPTRRSRNGQRGVISCLDFAPDYSGLFAAGSFGGTTGLYVENDPKMITQLGGHTGGVTQVRFSHDGLYLFTAARCDDDIVLWDVRSTCRELGRFSRCSRGNQRIGFDLSADSRGLVSASQDGRVLAFDCTDPSQSPVVWLSFGEATNAAVMHPALPLLAVAVGERHFELPTEATGEDGTALQELDACAAEQNGFSIWQLPLATGDEPVVSSTTLDTPATGDVGSSETTIQPTKCVDNGCFDEATLATG